MLYPEFPRLKPQREQKHFIVTRLIRSEDNRVIACELEAVVNHQIRTIDWRELKDNSCWAMGWK
ncbi:MAG: TIGR02450 family Trp-rich protein [Gammaproteobacteria bacterium]|nr:TIGR02450 family Trp-rich protein [Gammaproteobacteria bacterium]